MVNAIILAGSPNTGPLKKYSKASHEALIEISGRPMVSYVLEALMSVEDIGEIVIVGPEINHLDIKGQKDIKFTNPGNTALESAINGLAVLPVSQKVLVVTSDIPLISAEAIKSFINQSKDIEADLFYPIVPRQEVEERYPSVERTYVKFKEGVFTGGNLFLINPAIVSRCASKAQEIVNLRKSPFKLSGLIGIGFVIKFLMRSLSLKEAEEKFSNLLGIRGVAVICPYPEVGFDVDKPSDLIIAEKLLSKTA